MNLEQANHLRSGDRLRVSETGLARHHLEGDVFEGIYVSQFESPVEGRMVIVHLGDKGAYGFRLDELKLLDGEDKKD